MNPVTCPTQKHFHVIFEQVGSFSKPNRTVISSSPEEALASFLRVLPYGWRGGVSVFDDQNCHEDEMPILHTYVGAR
jgi:hypothetical protein